MSAFTRPTDPDDKQWDSWTDGPPPMTNNLETLAGSLSEAGRGELLELSNRCIDESGFDNTLDVLCEIALFTPDDKWVAIRANAAGTKTICTAPDGTERTFWARDYTISATARKNTAMALRERVRDHLISASEIK